jgi:cytochrome c oxidase subunit 2
VSDHDHAAAVDPSTEPALHVDQWEGLWIRISLIMTAIFVVAITVAAVAMNIQVPGVGGRIDPTTLDEPGNPFAEPGLRELAPGKYEAYIVAQVWAFYPASIAVPEGAEVTFYVTSRDIQHGFKVVDTNINMMVLPGQISTLRAVFDEPGTHNIICHEYCGIAHHTMYGQITVESAEPPVEAAN